LKRLFSLALIPISEINEELNKLYNTLTVVSDFISKKQALEYFDNFIIKRILIALTH